MPVLDPVTIAVLLYLGDSTAKATVIPYLQQISSRLADASIDIPKVAAMAVGQWAGRKLGLLAAVDEAEVQLAKLDISLSEADRHLLRKLFLSLAVDDPDGRLNPFFERVRELLLESRDEHQQSVPRPLLTEMMDEVPKQGVHEVREWWAKVLIDALRGKGNDSERRFAIQHTRTFSPEMARMFDALHGEWVVVAPTEAQNTAIAALHSEALVESKQVNDVYAELTPSVRGILTCDVYVPVRARTLTFERGATPLDGLEVIISQTVGTAKNRVKLARLEKFRLTPKGERLSLALGYTRESGSIGGHSCLTRSQYAEEVMERLRAFENRAAGLRLRGPLDPNPPAT